MNKTRFCAFLLGCSHGRTRGPDTRSSALLCPRRWSALMADGTISLPKLPGAPHDLPHLTAWSACLTVTDEVPQGTCSCLSPAPSPYLLSKDITSPEHPPDATLDHPKPGSGAVHPVHAALCLWCASGGYLPAPGLHHRPSKIPVVHRQPWCLITVPWKQGNELKQRQ